MVFFFFMVPLVIEIVVTHDFTILPFTNQNNEMGDDFFCSWLKTRWWFHFFVSPLLVEDVWVFQTGGLCWLCGASNSLHLRITQPTMIIMKCH